MSGLLRVSKQLRAARPEWFFFFLIACELEPGSVLKFFSDFHYTLNKVHTPYYNLPSPRRCVRYDLTLPCSFPSHPAPHTRNHPHPCRSFVSQMHPILFPLWGLCTCSCLCLKSSPPLMTSARSVLISSPERAFPDHSADFLPKIYMMMFSRPDGPATGDSCNKACEEWGEAGWKQFQILSTPSKLVQFLVLSDVLCLVLADVEFAES